MGSAKTCCRPCQKGKRGENIEQKSNFSQYFKLVNRENGIEKIQREKFSGRTIAVRPEESFREKDGKSRVRTGNTDKGRKKQAKTEKEVDFFGFVGYNGTERRKRRKKERIKL